MDHVRSFIVNYVIRRVHNYVLLCSSKQMVHISLVNRLLSEVKYYVQGQGKICLKKALAICKAQAVIQIKALCEIIQKALNAQFDSRLGNIESHVIRILGERQLVAVSTAEFND